VAYLGITDAQLPVT